MKCSNIINILVAGCLSLAGSFTQADTVLIDFGGGSGAAGTNTFSNGWNNVKLKHDILGVIAGTQTTGVNKTKSGLQSNISVSVTPYPLLLGGLGSLAESTLIVPARSYSACSAVWEDLYGVPLSNNAMATGWSSGTIASLGGTQSMTISGLTEGSYTMSGVFTTGGLAGLLQFNWDNLPIHISAAGGALELKGVYMAGLQGSLIDLSLGPVDVANVADGGMFMVTWEFALKNAANVNLTFDTSLVTALSGAGISALAISDGYQVVIPEPGTACLGLLGGFAFLLRRKRNA